MSDVTVKQLAKVLGMTDDKLLAQLAEAGMTFNSVDQPVSSTEKVKLLGFLRRTHGKGEAAAAESTAPRQITLKRKTVSEITVAGVGPRGPSKTVNVEVRQKRTYVKRSSMTDEPEVDSEREDALRKLQESQTKREAEDLVIQEKDKRRHDEEARLRAIEDAKRQSEEDRLRAEAEARAAVEEAAKPRKEEPARSDVAPKPAVTPAPAAAALPPRKDHRVRDAVDEPARHKGPRAPRGREEGGSDEPAGKTYFGAELHLSKAGSERRGAAKKKPRPRPGEMQKQQPGGLAHGFSRPTAPVVREVAIGESIIVADLAQKMAVKGAEVVKKLFKMGVMATINQAIDHDTAVLVVEEMGHTAVAEIGTDAESVLVAKTDIAGNKEIRPPVVTIMGQDLVARLHSSHQGGVR